MPARDAGIHAFGAKAKARMAGPGSGHDWERWRCHSAWMRGGWVYIVTNRANGTLYVGVTSDLARRAAEHRDGALDGFTRKYGLKRLVFAEAHDEIAEAIRREKAIKHCTRARKVRLIETDNPRRDDLYDRLA